MGANNGAFSAIKAKIKGKAIPSARAATVIPVSLVKKVFRPLRSLKNVCMLKNIY
jgi:hypothetical protein